MKINVVKEETNYTIYPGRNGGAYSTSRMLYEKLKYNKSSTFAYGGVLTEAIDFTVDEHEKGSIIVLSTDVNAVNQVKNKLVNWVKQKIKTIENRLTYKSKIDRIAQSNELVGWTIGRYLDGRYTAKDGTAFGENSLSILIVGVDTDKMVKIATELCRDFTQEAVLLKDFTTGNIYFVNPE